MQKNMLHASWTPAAAAAASVSNFRTLNKLCVVRYVDKQKKHQSLHPLMPLLKPYSPRRMCLVVAAALTLVFAIFLSLAVGASLAFGPSLDGNVLNNISAQGMAPLVGAPLAKLLSAVIRLGYMVSLVANLLLYVHPLRGYVAELIWPTSEAAAPVAAAHPAPSEPSRADGGGDGEGTAVPHALAACTLQDVAVETAHQSSSAAAAQQQQQLQHEQPGYVVAADPAAAAVGAGATAQLLRWQRNEQRHYLVLTYTELAVIAGVAVAVPNIFTALSAIGDLASTIQAFIIPGLIALVLARHRAQLHAVGKRQQPPEPAEPDEEAALLVAGGADIKPSPAEDSGQASDVLPPAAARRSGGKGHVLYFSSFRLRRGGQHPKLRQVAWEAWGLSADWAEQASLRGLGGLVLVLGVALFLNGIVSRCLT